MLWTEMCTDVGGVIVCFFFFKQKTAYEMRISDWSSDVCSSDLLFGTMRSRVAVTQHPQNMQDGLPRHLHRGVGTGKPAVNIYLWAQERRQKPQIPLI